MDQYSIGFVADTHDARNPLGLIDGMGQAGFDYNVHLGDIGGSRLVMRAVRKFKEHLGDVGHLPTAQLSHYEAAVAAGVKPLSAYIETTLGAQTMGLRAAETIDLYCGVLKRMAPLSNPILLRGNVDTMQLRSLGVQLCFARHAMPLDDWPRMVDLDWLGLLVWPSVRPASVFEERELAAVARALAKIAANKERIVVLAHEHIFKGPVAHHYAARVAAAGLRQLSIPRYDPNPSWRHLVPLLRSLPPRVRVDYVFGHVHDPAAVMLAGAPALRNPEGPGLRYRLYGLSWRGERGALQNGDRRAITLLPVGVDEIGHLAISRGDRGTTWRVTRQEPAR